MKLDLELLQVKEAERREAFRRVERTGKRDLTDVRNAKVFGMPQDYCYVCEQNRVKKGSRSRVCNRCRSRVAENRRDLWLTKKEAALPAPTRCQCADCNQRDSRRRCITRENR